MDNISSIIRPCKAPTSGITDEELVTLQFPILVSDKEDGIRALCHPKYGPCSQKMKPIPNHWIRSQLATLLPYLDGELVVPGMDFNEIQSVVMSRSHPCQTLFEYRVFDYFQFTDRTYQKRLIQLLGYVQLCQDTGFLWIQFLQQTYCNTIIEAILLEADALRRGKEGIMLRDPNGIYKQGRSTLREQILLKRKPLETDEAEIIGFVEQLENCNDPIQDEWGLQKRSSHVENMYGKDTLGAFIVRWHELEFSVGSGDGLTNELRKQIWDHQDNYQGQIITFSYQKFGMKNLPRLPKFKGFRKD